MAKDPASTRIPRLDGVSRIPQPGSLRPASIAGRPSQILRPAATFLAPRTTSLSGLRPPTSSLSANLLKKSSSGERINNAVNIMSKKTTSALKKLFSKPEKPVTPTQQTPVRKTIESLGDQQLSTLHKNQQNSPCLPAEDEVMNGKLIASTPRPLTRSDTFVRDANEQLDILGITHDIIVQSTPASSSSAKDVLGERTRLLTASSRHALYTTRSLETAPNPQFGETLTLDGTKIIQHNHTLESTQTSCVGFGHTIDLDSPLKAKQPKSTPQLMGDTITLSTKTDNNKINIQADSEAEPMSQTFTSKPPTLEKQATFDLTESKSNVDAPPSFYSAKSSQEDLPLLEDVSMPSECEIDITIKPHNSYMELLDLTTENLDDTLPVLAPDKANMKLPLNSTMQTERLLDLTTNALSSPRHMQLLNLTRDYMDSPMVGGLNPKNTTQLLYMTQVASSSSTPDRLTKFGERVGVQQSYQNSPLPAKFITPLLMKGAQSELILPTRTPDDELLSEPMDVDTTLTALSARQEEFYAQAQQAHQHQLPTQSQQASSAAVSLQELNSAGSGKPKSRFSFGLDLTESTLDCSIELCDISLSSTVLSQPGAQMNGSNMTQSPTSQQQQLLKKQNSFEMDESLGILTPDQMKEFLDSTNTTNTNNLDLPLNASHNNVGCNMNQKMSFHAMRFDQTPSPEELPLDPVEVKTDISDVVLAQQQQQHAAFSAASTQQQRQQLQQQHLQSCSQSTEPASVSCDTDCRSTTDQMTKSSVSKISTSFITSVTSVTSLDTGYQGDGEMSRPASRGAGDHSPSNGPTQRKCGHVSRQPSFNQQQLQQQQPPIRRQDPMTDSDFFTESDADDIYHRGDRRAQVIDGQLYGPMLQTGSASVFITEDPQMEDSCMESSGIFTDVENRCDDDLALLRHQDTQDVDMSPDGDSTDTVKSNRIGTKRNAMTLLENESDAAESHGQGQYHSQQQPQPQPQQQQQQQHLLLSDSQTSSTIQSSFSNDRISMTTEAAGTTLSNRTSYCSVDDGGSGGGVSVVDGAMHVDCKSFGSLEEALALNSNTGEAPIKSFGIGKTLTSELTKANSTRAASVARVSSPRKHSSLTSLSTINSAHANTSLTPVSKAKHATSASSTSSSKCSLNGANKISTNGSETCAKATSASSHLKTSPANARTPINSISPTSQSNASAANLRKALTPNKWDAVMNKIASNKLLLKKNYNDVKSKVSTGVVVGAGGVALVAPTASAAVRRSPSSVSVGRASPNAKVKVLNSKCSPPTNNGQPTDTGSGLQSPQAKRLLQGAPKRGRSYSKDSQKSSQSDLSFSSGSPKLLAKTPLRAAKKRDVRNLSISPTDLGPPPKTQQTANGASTRPKSANVTLTQKRILHSVSSAATPSDPSATNTTNTDASNTTIKSSPSIKKFTLLNTRRLDANTSTKTSTAPTKSPLKDHNQLITAPVQLQQQQSISTTTITTATNNKNAIVASHSNNSSKPQTPTTENHENTNGLQHHPQHNNSNNKGKQQANNVTATRNSSQTPSPILSQQHGRKLNNNNSTTTVTILEKKNSTKLQSSSRKQLQKQQSSSEEVVQQQATSSVVVELQQATKALKHQQTGIEAMGVLLQYLVFDLDAFACPAVKLERTKAKESLTKTMHLLDEAKSVCNELQYQLCDKELYYSHREEELQALHRCELEKAQFNLSEAELRASEQISALKTEIRVQEIEHKRSLDCYRLEMDNKLEQNQKHLLAAEQREKDLIERVAALEASEHNLSRQLQAVEESSAQRLQASKLRERELLEKIRVLNSELDVLRETKDSSERELKDKLNLSQDEVSVLRLSSRRSINNESMERGGCSPRNSSSTSVAAATLEITRLQSEAESLRCVLELKQKEISKLTKQNEELMRDASERNALQAKISLLESSNEMLQSELEIKSDKEKDFLRQMDDIQKAFNHETVKRTRLSYDNEALQWQLKQRSEQLHIVEAKLQELSSSHELHNSHNNSSLGSHSFSRSSQNGTSLMNFQVDDDVSPPASPIIKAVIEKTDSVSWVLEMDDDTPEAAASKMVKRAGSFRSVERSPSTRRQFSQSASAAMTVNGGNACNGGTGGPNPLSQSMSAASVIRQHSNGTTDFLGRANSRMRSKSVSVKSSEPCAVAGANNKSNSKKLLRQSSTGNARKQELATCAWKEPISSSSPFAGVRPRSSTMKCGADQEEAFFRRSSRKLITCDTSALNTGERLELRGLPTHPSVHDLKTHKKSQLIQESAGEAMVSGTNSEDEGCSHSSDEVVSSSTTSTSSAASASSGSSLSLNNLKNHHHMSLEEEVLLLDKINSLNGTPMEVSWSDDADPFAANGSSTV